MTSFAERLIERMAPWNTGPTATGGTEVSTALELYCKAIAKPYETLLEACEEEGQQGEAGWVPAWGRIFNPQTCPNRFLGYLGMYVGVSIPKVATEAEARELVKNEAGLARGTRKSLEESITRVLGSEKAFIIEERVNGSAEARGYFFLVYVEAGKISNALYEAINATKPAGLQYEVIEMTGVWLQGAKTWEEVPVGATWATIIPGEY